MRRTLSIAALACIGFPGGVAHADLFYSFDVAQSGYRLAPGQSIQVPVYLTEALTPPSSSFLAAELGLRSAGVLVQRTDSSLETPVLLSGAVANEDDFDDLPALIVVADEQASILVLRDPGHDAGFLAEEDFPDWGVRRFLLGVFTLTASSAVGETTTFHVGDNSTDDTRTWRSYILLDEEIHATSFTVTVVPEPAALGLLAAGALGLGRTRNPRR